MSNELTSIRTRWLDFASLADPRFTSRTDVTQWRNTLAFTHVTDAKWLGADVGLRYTLPLVRQATRNSRWGNETFSSLGDASIAGLLGWHRGHLHVLAGLELYLPTGHWEVGIPHVSIGANYYSIEPSAAITWRPPGFELSAKLAHNIKGRNIDSRYESGDELRLDYLMAWHGERWALGVSGYRVDQRSADRIGRQYIPTTHAAARAMGPSLRYTDTAGRSFTLEAHDTSNAGEAIERRQIAFRFASAF